MIHPIRTVLLLFWIASILFPTDTIGQHGHHGEPQDPLRLSDLLEEVRLNNPTLRSAQLQAEALTHKRDQVATYPDPTVMFTYQPFPVLTARGTQRTQWRVEQMIPYPGKLGLQGDLADLTADISNYDVETLAFDLSLQVKHSYYELYRIQQQVELILGFQDRLRVFEEAASTQYEVGTGKQQAILKAQLERNALSRSLLDYAERRQTALEDLSHLLNRPLALDSLAKIDHDAQPVPAIDVTALLEIALRNRPEMSALNVAEQRADTQIALAHKQFMPDFGVSLTYFDIGASDVPPSATGRDAFAITAAVKVPLQRRRLRARLEESKVYRTQVDARQEDLESGIRTRIADLRSRLQEETRQLTLFQDVLIPQAEATLEATLNAYTTGGTDFLNLLDAERMLFSLRTGFEDAQARYLKSTATLERTLGVTSLSDLNSF